jgi:hypothetical protein
MYFTIITIFDSYAKEDAMRKGAIFLFLSLMLMSASQASATEKIVPHTCDMFGNIPKVSENLVFYNYLDGVCFGRKAEGRIADTSSLEQYDGFSIVKNMRPGTMLLVVIGTVGQKDNDEVYLIHNAFAVSKKGSAFEGWEFSTFTVLNTEAVPVWVPLTENGIRSKFFGALFVIVSEVPEKGTESSVQDKVRKAVEAHVDFMDKTAHYKCDEPPKKQT